MDLLMSPQHNEDCSTDPVVEACEDDKLISLCEEDVVMELEFMKMCINFEPKESGMYCMHCYCPCCWCCYDLV